MIAKVTCQKLSTNQINFSNISISHGPYSHLRSEALYQALIGISLSQGLTHLLLMLSYELSHVPWLCYSLGLLFHYSTLVTLNWMATLPIVTVLEVFRRLWYEKAWIIAPFAAFSTSKSTKIHYFHDCFVVTKFYEKSSSLVSVKNFDFQN